MTQYMLHDTPVATIAAKNELPETKALFGALGTKEAYAVMNKTLVLQHGQEEPSS